MLPKQTYGNVGPSLAVPLEFLAHPQKISTLSLFYRFYFGTCSSKLAQWYHFLILEGGLLTILIYCMIFYHHSQMLQGCQQFFPCTARLWNSLPVESFPLTYDLILTLRAAAMKNFATDSATYSEIFWAYSYLHNKWTQRDCGTSSNSILMLMIFY